MKGSLFKVFRLLSPYRKAIYLGIFLTLLPAGLKIFIPYLLGRTIDLGISGKNIDVFYYFCALFLGAQVFIFLIQSFTNFFLIRLGLKVLVDYRTELLEKILSFKINFFDSHPAGKISTRLTNDVNSLQELFSSALIVLVGNLFLIFGVLVAMFFLNWELALVTLIITPGLIYLMKAFQYRMRRRFGFMRKSLSALNSYSGESFTGIEDIRGLGARIENRNEFERFSSKYADRQLGASREYAVFNPMTYFVTSLMSIFVLLYGSWAYVKGEMTVGEIAAFLTYANFFAWPLQELAEKYSVLQQALAAVDRLMEIVDHPTEENRGTKDFRDFQSIQFQDVSFQYSTHEKMVLKKVSFEIRRGEKIAFIGETGAGKSTTCSLLMRFYDPSSGSIRFDQNDLHEFEISSLRRRVGWVSQDVMLFAASLRDNLCFFQKDIPDAEIWRFLEILQLADWVRSLPQGLEEPVSERATSLSAGQKQLISIARALLPKPSIFIFDEATSHIDSQTEFLVQEALENLWRMNEFEKTTGLIIAHRLSTIRRCDRIFVFKDGEILETGSFDELMKLQGYAFSLQQKQYRVAT
jgi:ATP-binding cassette subfamily B protein